MRLFSSVLNTLILSVVSVGVISFAAPNVVGAQQIKNNLCAGANLSLSDVNASGDTCKDTGQAEKSLDQIIASIVNIFSIVVAIVAVIMIIIAGFKYVTSGGDSSKVGSAKSTIIYAIVGLIIVGLAQFIVKFVLKNISS